jgi:hypothetical protein
MPYTVTNIYVCAKVCRKNYTGEMEKEWTNKSLPIIILEIVKYWKQ